MRKAQELRDSHIKYAERMWEIDVSLVIDGCACTQAPGGTRKISKAVDRYGRGFRKWRDKKGRCHMGHVMFNGMNRSAARIARTTLGQQLGDRMPTAPSAYTVENE